MDTDKSVHRLQSLIEQKSYYKAALLAANMLESGIYAEQILITRREAVMDGVFHDIEQLSVKYPYLNPEGAYIEIKSGRSGIYDLMAEGLFFIGNHAEKNQDKKLIIDRIRREKETEKTIRKFMKLFEVESDYFSTQVHMEGLKYDKSQIYNDLSTLFAQYWEVMSIMSNVEILRMLKVIPFISSIRGDMKRSAEAISFIMDMEVDITKEFLKAPTSDNMPETNEMRLGDNFVLAIGGSQENLEETIVVTISELDSLQCGQFIKGHKKDLIVNYLCDMLLDANTSIQIKLNPHDESRCFYLAQSDNGESYLGINTYL